MGDLSKNFNRSEFACKGLSCCGDSAPVDSRLVKALQELRDIVGPLIITSGFRCRTHNAKVGGAINSQHPLGTAVDVRSPVLPPVQLANEARKVSAFNQGGIGTYSGWVHLDVRTTGAARWEG